MRQTRRSFFLTSGGALAFGAAPSDQVVLGVIGSGGFAHFAEYITWLMGYETLCVALCEQRDLVAAISRKLIDMYVVFLNRLLQPLLEAVLLAAGERALRFLQLLERPGPLGGSILSVALLILQRLLHLLDRLLRLIAGPAELR
jgi:hypothetical protein